MASVGVVAIGRNEGERLRRCLQSLLPARVPIVYVVSASTDGSIDLARGLGVDVVSLDLSIPFTAARARNAGLQRLRQIDPTLELVQFVDGDCEVAPGWIDRAAEALRDDATLAVVCGRRREAHPEHSIWNRLCDIEWDTPIGEAAACGGDALMRVAAFQQVGGFDESLIAGEEPDLCLRLRRAGWRIRRIDAEMTLHDAAMLRFGQWWKRAVRAGHAYAEGAARHGRGPERHWVRERRRILFWGFGLPLVVAVGLVFCWPWPLLALALYPLQALRIAWRARRRVGSGLALAFGVACLAAKFPEFVGLLRYTLRRSGREPGRIIEYK